MVERLSEPESEPVSSLIISSSTVDLPFFDLLKRLIYDDDNTARVKALSLYDKLEAGENGLPIWAMLHHLDPRASEVVANYERVSPSGEQLRLEIKNYGIPQNGLEYDALFKCLDCSHEYRGKSTTKRLRCRKCGSYRVSKIGN